MEEQKKVRCAIYTRKSTDEGLDKEFNTLEAQREAGANYILSQKHQGWVLLDERYDDGGFSGGNINRPALKRLIHDVEAGKIDMIVVYKIDRLTRSNAVPNNYFSIFNEIAGLFVDMIESGLTISDNVIPDISVGLVWGKYWLEQNLSAEYGERVKYEHDYPDYYPQSKSNPQAPWAYPIQALPVFREWFKNNYLAIKFPKYIIDKTKFVSAEKEKAMKLIENLNGKKLIA